VSQQNIELARRMTDAFLDGDWDAALALLHRDVEFEAAARPDAGVWRGREGVRRAVAEWVGTWDEYPLEVREYLDALTIACWFYGLSGDAAEPAGSRLSIRVATC
jgi:SnoaL-like domain